EFYVACDKKIHLSQPLHLILREVYSASIARDFPYLTTLKFKIRSFDVLENEALSLELKRDIAFWLEEAICNVGKYAKNATRLEVKGCYAVGCYTLIVQDNGPGLHGNRVGQGTQQGRSLEKKLGGSFKRESLPQGGVLCELGWPTSGSAL
ncbi:MAG: histidine kinase, partial [Prochlorotrichaceae cyanobacterium]